MEVTRTEQVTNTYCDVCGDNITNQSQIGTGDKNAKFDYVVCMGYRKYVLTLRDQPESVLSCELLAKLYTRYPELANETFSKTLIKGD